MAETEQSAGRPAARAIGLWLAAPMAALQAVNAGRAAFDPVGFAVYMGAPLVAPADAAWVFIYGARTAFIALLVAAFLIRRDVHALKWTALAALILPLGDAWIAHQAGAGAATVVRHAAIAGYVLLATIVLFAAANGQVRAAPK